MKRWWPLLLGLSAVGVSVLIARQRREELKALLVERVLERPSDGQTYAALAQRLERQGEGLLARLDALPDTPRNWEVLRHIIGIEAWGQARLQALMDGGEVPTDGYRAYRPDESLGLKPLAAEFGHTRARTAALARTLGLHPPDAGVRARHNSLGALSARGWLRYLLLHAGAEARRLGR